VREYFGVKFLSCGFITYLMSLSEMKFNDNSKICISHNLFLGVIEGYRVFEIVKNEYEVK